MDPSLASLLPLLRPELSELAAYVPHDPEGIEVKLDANEAPSTSAHVREVAARAMASVALERYPDPRALRLKDAIAKRTGARPRDLLVGSGSDELIALVTNAFAQPRRRNTQAIVLTPTPTFVMYKITARGHGAKPVEVPLDPTWDLDVAMMRRAFQIMEPSVVYIASPNNPTGNAMSRDRVEKVVELARSVGGMAGLGQERPRVPAEAGTTTMVSAKPSEEAAPKEACFCVLDEAYVDYAGPNASLRGLRASQAHVGILRTLSKVGLAALRIGWLEADPVIVEEIDKTRQPFNVSATSQAAAAAVLEEAWDAVQADVAAIVLAREELAKALAELPGFQVTPSSANFVWVKTPGPAEDVHAHLVREKILVRSFHRSGGRLTNQLRITVGTSAQNDRLLTALRKVGA
ncbi:MAG: aminotransferase class I/II-fold pyridoxal phosphate-dependent enzyme [Deltaproteobacteria bacterium]|nr:aminotransferase class I/II-fold pyridoxal phosphate-dependent enzyme [Deltaproteobacteria bacterium]